MARTRETWELVKDFELYCKVCDQLSTEPQSSYHDVMEKMGDRVSVASLSGVVSRLEAEYGTILIDRSRRSGHNTLTPSGRRLYERIKALLEDVSAWPAETVRVAAPNLVMMYGLPPVTKWMSPERKVDLRITEESNISRLAEDLLTGKLDFALVWDVLERKREAAERGLDYQIFGPHFDLVLVCPMGHGLVDLAREAARDGREWRAPLSRLDQELVYVLPRGNQPLLDYIPLPDRHNGGDRVEMDNYISMVSHMRGGGRGVAIMPAFYHELDHFRAFGQLFYARIDIDTITMKMSRKEKPDDHIRVACIRRKSGFLMSEPAEKLLKTIKEHLDTLPTEAGWREGMESKKLPTDIKVYENYKKLYHVTSKITGYTIPEWRNGEVNLVAIIPPLKKGSDSARNTGNGKNLSNIEGSLRVLKPGHQLFQDYTLSGELLGHHVLCLRGFRFIDKNHNDQFVAMFNTIDHESRALIGMWSGTDDLGWPTTAPIILAEADIEPSRLSIMAHTSMLRFMANADVGAFSESRTGG